MTVTRLTFKTAAGELVIECDNAPAPRTLAALLRTLPCEVDLHTPKIGGNHIYWHAPFVCDLEQPSDVMSAPAGAFLYWPERQFLELVFAPLQAETAAVTVLGRVVGDAEVLLGLAAELGGRQGRAPFNATLRQLDASPSLATEPASEAPPALIAAREAVWRACPVEIERLLDSRAIMHPAGPLFMADGELRVLHETLWQCRAVWRSDETGPGLTIAAFMLRRVAARLRDFCHLHETAATLELTAASLTVPDAPADAVLDETILICGRLSAWLDLNIPWNDVNEAVRAARAPLQSARPASSART